MEMFCKYFVKCNGNDQRMKLMENHHTSESGEENTEQDDEMEKHELENEARQRSNNNNPDTYVSCYPYSRRYSMANAMASNRPSTAIVNQGYHHAVPDDGDDEYETGNQHDTKIEIPSHPPQYSPASDKSADKKVKVSRKIPFFLNCFIGFSCCRSCPHFDKN